MPRAQWPLLVNVPLPAVLAVANLDCGDILDLDDYGVAEPTERSPNAYSQPAAR